MLLSKVTGALLAVSAVDALKHAAPFFTLSQKSLGVTYSNPQIAPARDVENTLMSGLSDCERASYYILIQQPGVKASDISTESMPQLHSWLNGTASKQLETTSVPEVVGEWDLEQVAERISDICNLDVWRHEAILKLIKTPRAALYLSLPEVKGDERSKRLADTDDHINTILQTLSQDRPWVIIFSGSYKTAQSLYSQQEHQDPPYEMDEQSPLHMNLKRDVELHNQRVNALARRQSNGTDDAQSSLPLFEKYQFLSPAIFMGLSVSLLLILILYVGITAIAGLEVSYMAFAKEMGPQAQKGKQQ